MNDATTYYISVDGIVTGPFRSAQLMTFKQTGMLSADNLVSTDKTDWQQAAELHWLFPSHSIHLQPQSHLETITAGPMIDETANETADDTADEVSGTRLAGDVVAMVWNATGHLLKLAAAGPSRVIPIALSIALAYGIALTVPAALVAAPRIGGGKSALEITLYALLACPVSLILTWLELLLSRCLFCRDDAAYPHADVLLAVSVFLNQAGACAAIAVITRLLPGVAGILVTMVACSFFVCNAAAALRIGLCRLSGVRPYTAVYLSALLIWLQAVPPAILLGY